MKFIIGIIIFSISLVTTGIGTAGIFMDCWPLCTAETGIGPSIARITGGPDNGEGYSINFDTAYVSGTKFALRPNDLPFILNYSLNLKYISIDDVDIFGPQFELCLYLLFNVGGGAGYMWGTRHGAAYHAFAGLPLPLTWSKVTERIEAVYVEPYYRFNVIDGSVYHEIGMMLKFGIDMLPGPPH